MSRVVYHRNEQGTRQLLGSKQMQDAMMNLTTRRYFPVIVRMSPSRTGDYARSWAVDAGYRELGRRNPARRAAAYLHNSAPHSGKVEQAHKVMAQLRAYIALDNKGV